MMKTFEQFIIENSKISQRLKRMEICYPGKEISDLTYKEYIENILKNSTSNSDNEIIIKLPDNFELSSTDVYKYSFMRMRETEKQNINKKIKIEKFICDFINVYWDCNKKCIKYFLFSDKDTRRNINGSISFTSYYCTLNDLTDESKKKIEEYIKNTYCDPKVMFAADDYDFFY